MVPWTTVIAHADLDAFYAAVEQLDDPSLRGKPLLVGPNSQRGVVLTASYAARPFGVGSAMPMAEARQRCPKALIVPPRFERYAEISRQVMAVFADFSPDVEPLSLDEAFLDMSGAEQIFGEPESIGRQIKDAVREATGLTISVGIAATKYVAKVASAHGKPDGLVVVPPESAVAWLAPLPVKWLWGAGKKTTAKLNAMGLQTIGDVAAADPADLRQRLGAAGSRFYELARAIDPRSVSRGRAGKSIGSERTLNEDVVQRADIEQHLRRSADRVAQRLRAKRYLAGGIRVKLKTSNFELLSRQRRLSVPADTAETLFKESQTLLDAFDHPGPFRLIGLAAFDLESRNETAQSDLFDDGRQRRLETTMDHIVGRFGKGAILRAEDLRDRSTVLDEGTNLDSLDGWDDETA
jgi:DNA polymerase-4